MLTPQRLTFQELKPLCVGLAERVTRLQGTKEERVQINQLLVSLVLKLRAVAHSQDTIDKRLAEYVFFPLSHIFRQAEKVSSLVLEQALQCLDILLVAGWSRDMDAGIRSQLLIFFTQMIDRPSPSGKGPSNENTQEAVLSCFQHLLQYSQAMLITMDQEQQGFVFLAQTISIMLDCMVDGATKSIRVTSTNILQVVVGCIESQSHTRQILPGILSCFTKLTSIQDRLQRPSRQILGVLQICESLLVRSMLDQPVNATKELALSMRMPKKPHSDLDAWLATSRAPITTAISTILRNLQASDGEIADAIFHMCQSLAEMGPTLDSNFLTFLLEMMIATSGAETMTAEAEESRIRVLVGIIKRQNELIELFKARLQLWTSGFSEATASLEQEGSKVYFNKIGISLVMADRLNIVTDNMLDNFSAQLLQSVERYFQVSKIADIPNIPNHNRDLSSRRSGVLSNETASNMIATAMSTNTGASTLHSFANLLRYLGMTSVSTLLTTKISRKIGINPPEQLAAILWLTLAILDSRHVHSLVRLSSSTASNVLSQDLDATGEEQLIFLYPVCLDVMMMPSSGADWRVLLLSLEVFRKMANSLQSDFDPELVDVLLPLVSCLGHPNSTVQSFSVTCLNEISLACGYPSAQNLLLRNADYLINSIAMKINTFDVDPQVLQALTLLVKISDSAIIPYLADITDSIFSILLSHHGYAMLTRSSFDFLRSIITKLQELRASKAIDDDAKDRSKSTLTLRAVIEQLGCFDSEVSVDDVAVQTNTDWTDDNEIDRNTDKSGSPERCEDVQKRKIDDSTGLDMVRSIVELSQHYLMHESSELKVNLLGLIMEGSRLLCMDEDRYLPLVHQLWPVLINRLSDQQPSLRAATCDAISTICATAGDFVTTRLQDDWQQVRKIYDVTTAGFSIVVFETEIHALQGIPSTTLSSLNSLISMICSIATNVRLKDEQADELLDMLELFINYQPEVISALVALNVDLMWLHELQKQYKASVGVQWATPLGTNDVEFALLKE